MSATNDTIASAQVFRARSTLSRPIADATHQIGEIGFHVIEVTTAGGVRGQGYLLSFDYSQRTIEAALLQAAEFVVGYKPYETLLARGQWDAQAEYFGMEGINRSAFGALNLAMWDAWARTVDQPIWKMFGVSAHEVPVYGSGGWISYSIDELIEEVTGYQRRGFTAVKIKVGSGSLDNDLERLTKCREALGPQTAIMMDANQGMSLIDALDLAKRAQPLGIGWFEEPIDHRDYAGFARLRASSRISLAMGEREYDCEALRQLVERQALDLWQPDIIRLGGVEGWRASAEFAALHHLPVLPHYYKDYDVPLLCTISRPHAAESFDWIDAIIDNPMTITDGKARPRAEPGWGFRFLADHLTQVQ